MKNYLENNICKFTPLFDIDYVRELTAFHRILFLSLDFHIETYRNNITYIINKFLKEKSVF